MPSSMPMSRSCSSSSSELKYVVVVTREPAPVSSKVNCICMDGISGLGSPSGVANPSRTSKPLSGSTESHSQ